MKKDFANSIGMPADRVEGKAKVTGSAKYAAEYKPEGLTYGVLVTSTIAKGRITGIDSKQAERMPGVISVVSHLNRPDVPGWNKVGGESRVEGQEYRIFYDDRIYYNHQPVALVIADTPERANDAANTVKVSYEKEEHITNLEANTGKAAKPKRGQDYKRGTADAYQSAPVKIEAEYSTPLQVHTPMEMHAATTDWKGEKLKHYNKTQATKIAQKDIMTAFKLEEKNIEIHSPYVGGAFGSSSRIWPQEMAALLGAKKTGRPVTVMARRDQVFNMVGYRPASLQKIGIGATADGTITGITHHAIGSTSTYEEFTERIIDPTKTLYACENCTTSYKLVPLNMSTPCWTRGPGETSGSFALESAVDELSYALKMDPLALRLKNFAAKDPFSGKPWSSNYLKDCYEKGAAQFGWNKRKSMPRSMPSSNGWLTGMGMAAGIYKATRSPASASATLLSNGNLLLQSAVADVGPGSATVMTQIAADAFDTELANVQFQWGNSSLPPAPGQFGSHTTASVGAAVHDAVKALQQKLKELAVNNLGSPLAGRKTNELINGRGMITSGNTQLLYTDILKQNNLPQLKVTIESKSGSEMEQFAGNSFCAHFVEVQVHPTTGQIKVTKVVSAIDAGKVINHKTATSQVYGSITWGIGIALMEEGIIDHRYGRYINNNFADYHIPVNADIPDIDVIFIDKPDPVLDPMGSKGLGEIGLVGFTAAIANAVYHATGKRVRALPITPDKLL